MHILELSALGVLRKRTHIFGSEEIDVRKREWESSLCVYMDGVEMRE